MRWALFRPRPGLALRCARSASTVAFLLGCSQPASIAAEDASSDVFVMPDAGADSAMSAESGTDAGSDAAITPADVLAKLNNCAKELTVGRYKADDTQSSPANIPVCGLVNAVYWQADMDIDCDGKITTQCSLQTDPAFQNQTAATDSKGQPLDAANLPYVVVPIPSAQRWDYKTGPLQLGSVVLVLYNGKMEYGIVGDIGPTLSIGEASYAMAVSLGIDPNPKTGGIDKGVTYIAFTGKSAVVSKNEDHAEAVSIGKTRLAQLLQEN